MDQLATNRGGYRFDVRLFKASMQGDDAAASMVAALLEVHQLSEQSATRYDVVVIIRGGGAQVDLDCFDTYELATHIAQFPLPVITGIGHERDETVADLVAHTKMKTPTAVAEFLINGITTYDERLEASWQRVVNRTEQLLREHTFRLDSLQTTVKYTVSSQMQQQRQQLAQYQDRLQYASQILLRQQHENLVRWPETLRTRTTLQLQRWQRQLATQEKVISLLDPASILRRGFTQTYVNGTPLAQAGKVAAGAILRTITHDNQYTSTVQEHQKRNHGQEEN